METSVGIHLVGDDMKIALVYGYDGSNIFEILFDSLNIEVIICQTTKSLTLIRRPGVSLRMDHPQIKKLIEEAGESRQWRANQNGDYYSRDGRKMFLSGPSRIDIQELVRIITAHL